MCIEIAMLHTVPPASYKMAASAVVAVRHANPLSDSHQINTLDRVTGISLHIEPAVVVAYKTIHILSLGEIEIRILPPITGMA